MLKVKQYLSNLIPKSWEPFTYQLNLPIILIWVSIVFLQFIFFNNKIFVGWLTLCLEFFIDMLLIFFSFCFYRRYKSKSKKMQLAAFMLFVSFLSISFSDFYYNAMLSILRIVPPAQVIDPIDLSLFCFLIFQLMAWFLLLLDNNIREKRGIVFLDVPVFFIFISILLILSFNPFFKLLSSVQNNYHVSSIIAELFSMFFAMLCLFFSKNRGLTLLASGYLILISSDLLLRLSFFEHTIMNTSYLQVLWSLGELTMLCALVYLIKSKKQSLQLFNSIHSLETQTALWTHVLSFVSLLFFIGCILIIMPKNKDLYNEIIKTLPAIFILYSIFTVLSSHWFSSKLLMPFKIIKENIQSYHRLTDEYNNETILKKIETDVQEFNELFNFISKAFDMLNQRYGVEKYYFDNAVQVAHDIRSPIAALNMFVASLDGLTNKHAKFINEVLLRINNIADNLLSFYKYKSIDKQEEMSLQVEHIPQIIDSIIHEKKVQYIEKEIEFSTNMGQSNLDAFSKINKSKLKIILSNLINNAVDAIDNSAGKIKILLTLDNDHIFICISDNGAGIDAINSNKLFKPGYSSKVNGTGLGLFDARRILDSWRGELTLESIINVGTCVTIKLQREPSPAWFLTSIELSADDVIVILDDDPSIHYVWDQLLLKKFPNLCLYHFYNSSKFIEWNTFNHLNNLKVFVDYTLHGEALNGLDVIEHLNIKNNVVLVTQHSDDPHIISRVTKLSIKILSKNMLAYII